MLSNVQRAEVESKSQHDEYCNDDGICCYQMYKELKLKANHNNFNDKVTISNVVIKCTKSWSWKQITTAEVYLANNRALLSNVQRAEVESKSQR